MQLSTRIRNKIPEIISAIFILVFVYTASSKLIDHSKFIGVLHHSPLMSGYETLVSWIVPFVELVIATLLFFPATRTTGLIASLGLLVGFTAYIGYLIVYSSHLPCTCGGVIEKLTWRQHFLFNTLLILLALTAIFPHKLFIAINRGSQKPVKRVGINS